LMVRETPLHAGHLRLMRELALTGAVILPPVPGFYALPKTVDDVVDHSVGKALDQLGVEHTLFRRWSGPDGGRAADGGRGAEPPDSGASPPPPARRRSWPPRAAPPPSRASST